MSWIISIILSLFASTFISACFYFVFYIIYIFIRKKVVARVIYFYIKLLLLVQVILLLLNFALVLFYIFYDSVFILPIPSHMTGKTFPVIVLVFAVWFIGFNSTFFPFVFSYYKFNKKMLKESRNIENEYIISISQDIKEKLQIKQNIKIRYSSAISTPVVFNALNLSILLPLEAKEKLDLYVVFFHEYIHIKNHDLMYKLFFKIVRSIFWFNPILFVFDKILKQYMEYNCDELSCCYGKNYFTQKQYFLTVLKFKQNFKGNSILLSTLYENNSDLERRIRNMKKFSVPTRKALCLSYTLLVIATILSISFSVVASAETINAYSSWSNCNITNQGIDSSSKQLREYSSTEKNVGETKEIASPTLSDTISINISAKPGDTYSTVDFYKHSGETVRITLALNPDNANMKAGLYTPNGSVYVLDSGSIDHTFDITEDGYYAVFIENVSTENVDVSGFAHIR